MILSFDQSKKLLTKYKIPFVKGELVESKTAAFNFVKKYGYPVVLKIDLPNILHKTDIGGVILDINNKEKLILSWDKLSKLGKVLIQKQIGGVGLIIGAKKDPIFGPIIMFGLGGIFAEALKDVSFRLAPINKKEAKEMISEIKGYKILKGYRGQEPVNLLKLEQILLLLSDLITKEKIQEIDLNPVMADSKKAIIVDAKILI
ncbi:MAG: acetate--CoA ligase family protein [Patescibacteria group bacterium]|nr:acetate--CoA ligase family protein [Patescibacteria group bacterium]